MKNLFLQERLLQKYELGRKFWPPWRFKIGREGSTLITENKKKRFCEWKDCLVLLQIYLMCNFHMNWSHGSSASLPRLDAPFHGLLWKISKNWLRYSHGFKFANSKWRNFCVYIWWSWNLYCVTQYKQVCSDDITDTSTT